MITTLYRHGIPDPASLTPQVASMYLGAIARAEQERMRDTILAARIAQADEKSFAKALKAIDPDANRQAPLTKDPNRVSLAEQAKRRKAGKQGSNHG